MKHKTNSNIAELLTLLLFLRDPRTLSEIQAHMGEQGSSRTAEQRISEIRKLGFVVNHRRRYPAKGICIHEYQIDFKASQIQDWRVLAVSLLE